MLDLGASINVMPTSIYKFLKFGDLEPIEMTIQLANMSVVQPLCVLEDVLVKVYELIFPTDFYFNIFEAMKHPTEDHSLFGIDLLDHLLNQVGQLDPKSTNDTSLSPPPPRELKPLSSHLKYAYLDTEQQLPIIIANNLHQEQGEKLLNILRQHKKAIGWKLSDLPSINPSICISQAHKAIAKKAESNHPRRGQEGMQVVPKKSGMTIMKNQHDELRVYIDYRRLNQATHKDHFPLPFIDQQGNPINDSWMDSLDICRSTLHLKINTRLPSLSHSVPLCTHAFHLAYAMHRVPFNVAR
ncbi:hypothetical protein CR513_16218, partial [Mucuna pruriens]